VTTMPMAQEQSFSCQPGGFKFNGDDGFHVTAGASGASLVTWWPSCFKQEVFRRRARR
jgi:hypothetical protein